MEYVKRKKKQLSKDLTSETLNSLRFSFDSEYLFTSNAEQEMIVWTAKENNMEMKKQ